MVNALQYCSFKRSVHHVEHLRKYYDVPIRDAGFVQAVKSLVNRQYNTVKAVDGVSFDIEPGEVIGFLGPNGTGKTTTLKMLSGLLHPTSGSCTVSATRRLNATMPICGR